MSSARRAVLMCHSSILACVVAAPLFLQSMSAQTIGGGSCGASNLSGTYSLILSGRAISTTGSLIGLYQGNGSAVFDGVGKVTFTGTVNTNLASGKAFSYSGSYTIPSNCAGTITLTAGSTASFTLAVWSAGSQFNITGSDATYVYSGSGTNNMPQACATATLSGPYSYTAAGSMLSGTTQSGTADEAGLLQFDGQGNVTSSYTITAAGTTAAAVTATGTYSVTSGCLAAKLTDSTGKTDTLSIVIEGDYGDNIDVLEASPQFVRTGAGHSAFLNPTRSINNAFSYAINATPPGGAFVLFGTDIANKSATAVGPPFATTLLNTKVTVNGEAAPLYYADTGQLNAVMPWDIPGGAVAAVVVTNGTATSNAAAIYVPATGTPGIAVYNSNRAVVVNNDNVTVNSSTAGANVGDEVAAYFTGGGPVNAAGKLVTGSGAPLGLSPVTGNSTVTVGGVNAVIKYIGLTPDTVGLYQVNFVVPQLAKGTYPVVITISNEASNALGGPTPNPVMTVSN